MEAENKNALLPLDEPRVIAIREGKFVYTFTFNRITGADWRRYFDGIYYASRNEGKAQVDTLDMNTPGLELVETTLAKVDGYARTLTKKEEFKKIKPFHANAVAWMLRAVAASAEESETPFDPENIEVRIDALWSQSRPGDETTMFKGLVHVFAAPTIEQKRRFYRAGAASKVIGGSRNGTTLHANRHGVLLDLYDQLILSVDGYSISGRPLESPEEIRREMDAYHKTIAVQQLFIGSSPADQNEEATAA